jgi:ABC-type transport system involved in multi-copper enzyme maturation permease subunit
MTPLLRSELLKLRTTRTTLGMIAAVVGLVLLAIALHAFGLPTRSVTHRRDQLSVFIDVGLNVGILFSAIAGAIVMTGEFRHGTIRPTLVVTPDRGRVLAAKAVTTLLLGLVFGALATGLAAAAGSLFLHARSITVNVHAGDYALLIVGGAIAGAVWSVIGFGLGAAVRDQVPVVVGIFVWVLFVENLLDGGFPAVGKFAPAALGRSLAGETTDTLHAPALAAALLVLYAAAALYAGWLITTHRDIA